MKRIISLLLVIVMLFGVTGCAKEASVKEEQPQPNEEGLIKEEGSHYPLKIKTYNYAKEPVEITFQKAPERVLAVYQNSIETLLALGLENKIIAASGLDHDVKEEYQEAFSKIKYYDNIPTKEEVLGMEADFILSWYSLFNEKNLGDVDFWHEREINTYMSQNGGVIKPNSIQNEYDDIINLGKIFDVEEKANEIVNNMKEKIAESKEFAKNQKSVRTVILEIGSDNMFRIYGEESIGGNVATEVGADLVAKENGNIGAEDLVKLNPEVIFTVYYGDEIDRDMAIESITLNPALSSISAIKSNRVHPIMLSEVYASGIRTLDGIISISKGLYPDLYK